MNYSISYMSHPEDELAWSPNMVANMGSLPSSGLTESVSVHLRRRNLVFPYFNRIAPEIRAIIWEEHFLESIGGRPQVHFLLAERPPRGLKCTFPECEGRYYTLVEYVKRHSGEQQ